MSRGRLFAGGGIAAIIIVVVALLFGVDPNRLLQQVDTGEVGSESGQQFSAAEEELREFVAVVLADTEDIWRELFPLAFNRQYQEPMLTLYTGHVASACGQASSASGPFYCPSDHQVYIDLSFFSELADRFGAAGDFAQAYVIAHEIGHHVQNQLGVLEQVRREAAGLDQTGIKRLAVRNELQADFLAGIWAHHARRMKDILEPGDVEEALNAASAIGDDRLQKVQQGYVLPDTFTHGTSEQRMRWFRLGLESGDVRRVMEPFRIDYEQL